MTEATNLTTMEANVTALTTELAAQIAIGNTRAAQMVALTTTRTGCQRWGDNHRLPRRSPRPVGRGSRTLGYRHPPAGGRQDHEGPQADAHPPGSVDPRFIEGLPATDLLRSDHRGGHDQHRRRFHRRGSSKPLLDNGPAPE